MNTSSKTMIAAAALGLGLAATPVLAQTVGPDRGFAAARATGETVQGYQPDGRLNVFGARLDPAQSGGPFGGVVDGVGAVGNAVGGVVGGTVGAADAVTTGSIAPRGRAGRGY